MEIWDIFLNFLDSQCKVTINSGKIIFLQNGFSIRNSDCIGTSTGENGAWLIEKFFIVIVNPKVSVRTHFHL